MPTKKMLISYDPESPTSRSSTFVVPSIDEGVSTFLGISNQKRVSLATVVLTGRALSENDLFARIVDAGWVVPDVQRMLGRLRAYLEIISSLKIGNIVALEAAQNDCGFTISVRAKRPAPERSRKLP